MRRKPLCQRKIIAAARRRTRIANIVLCCAQLAGHDVSDTTRSAIADAILGTLRPRQLRDLVSQAAAPEHFGMAHWAVMELTLPYFTLCGQRLGGPA